MKFQAIKNLLRRKDRCILWLVNYFKIFQKISLQSAISVDQTLLREPDGDSVADLAMGNFTEMRDKTADPKFLLQKKIEAWFSEKHPDKWIPQYTMVTYRG